MKQDTPLEMLVRKCIWFTELLELIDLSQMWLDWYELFLRKGCNCFILVLDPSKEVTNFESQYSTIYRIDAWSRLFFLLEVAHFKGRYSAEFVLIQSRIWIKQGEFPVAFERSIFRRLWFIQVAKFQKTLFATTNCTLHNAQLC